MANTVYHYAPTNWVNGTTPANATNMNHLETQALDVLSGLNPDLFTAFVLSGITCTKDGTIANQLDIAVGRAYAKQSDGTLALIVVAADNTHTTSAISSTYYLYLQPDGTWYWSTTNAPAANSLFIAQVTTDASGNILAVTDKRAGSLGVPMNVASPTEFNVTTTVLQNPLYQFTVPVQGFYRVSGHLYKHAGANSYVLLRVEYPGVHSGAPVLDSFMSISGGSGITNVMALQGSSSAAQLPDGEYGLYGPTFLAAYGTTHINIAYQDVSGTPNDYIYIVIERLA